MEWWHWLIALFVLVFADAALMWWSQRDDDDPGGARPITSLQVSSIDSLRKERGITDTDLPETEQEASALIDQLKQIPQAATPAQHDYIVPPFIEKEIARLEKQADLLNKGFKGFLVISFKRCLKYAVYALPVAYIFCGLLDWC